MPRLITAVIGLALVLAGDLLAGGEDGQRERDGGRRERRREARADEGGRGANTRAGAEGAARWGQRALPCPIRRGVRGENAPYRRKKTARRDPGGRKDADAPAEIRGRT